MKQEPLILNEMLDYINGQQIRMASTTLYTGELLTLTAEWGGNYIVKRGKTELCCTCQLNCAVRTFNAQL